MGGEGVHLKDEGSHLPGSSKGADAHSDMWREMPPQTSQHARPRLRGAGWDTSDSIEQSKKAQAPVSHGVGGGEGSISSAQGCSASL